MVTTDNGQNIKNAITEELELFHLDCIGHTLQVRPYKFLLLPASTCVGTCKTHWSSTYRMLERVQKQQAAICTVLAEERVRSIQSLLPEN